MFASYTYNINIARSVFGTHRNDDTKLWKAAPIRHTQTNITRAYFQPIKKDIKFAGRILDAAPRQTQHEYFQHDTATADLHCTHTHTHNHAKFYSPFLSFNNTFTIYKFGGMHTHTAPNTHTHTESDTMRIQFCTAYRKSFESIVRIYAPAISWYINLSGVNFAYVNTIRYTYVCTFLANIIIQRVDIENCNLKYFVSNTPCKFGLNSCNIYFYLN